MMVGNSLFNSAAPPQFMPGYVDPFAMGDMREAVDAYAQPSK